MPRPLTVFFVSFSAAFAIVHAMALKASLYWYFWWFDIIMHFWGGVLLGAGVHVLCSFSRIQIQPSLKLVLATILVATVSWEVFEWYVGLWLTEGYIFDTSKDIFLGFFGGLLAHYILRKHSTQS